MEPADYNNFTQFLLKYILSEGHLIGNGLFEPLFAGHQSLQEREETYYAKNQSLHCGFVEGPEGYPSSGFDLNEHDRAYMATCRVVVSSCIFGGSDYLRRPAKSKVMFLFLFCACIRNKYHVFQMQNDKSPSFAPWQSLCVFESHDACMLLQCSFVLS